MRRTVLLALLLTLFGLPACGGGGGGGDDGPSLPGTLLALAVEGTPTPAGVANPGHFAPINVGNPIMDAAAGGWVAFVATVNLDAGGAADILYVAEPDGTIHEVYAVGDPDPNGGGGLITGFACVWMCQDGTVFAYTTMSAPAFGVVSASVTGGGVTNRQKVVYQNDTLQGDAVNGVLGIAFNTAVIDETCTFWFLGTLANAAVGLYSIEPDGSGNVRHAITGQNVTPGAIVAAIDQFNVSWNGLHFGCVIDIGAGTRNIYTAAAGGVLQLVAQTGDTVPDLIGTFASTYKLGEPIYVGPGGQVLFIGVGSTGTPDDVLCLMDANPLNDLVIARTGDAPIATEPEEYNQISLIHQRVDGGSFPQFSATMVGGSVAIATYAFGGGVANRYVYNGRPYSGGGNFTGALPGLAATKLRGANRDISFAFRDQLDTGETGVFWVFPAQAPLAAALEGGSALGGTDTWGSFAATAHTSENLVLVFTALLTGSGSGLFRQG